MRNLKQRTSIRHRFIALFVAVGMFFVGVIGMVSTASVYAATEQKKPTPAAGQRLITIHDNGTDRGILTTANTLRKAFAGAGIPIDPNDLVEPGLDEPLVASNYEVNIYRARPVTIVDGSVRTKVMSAFHIPAQIAEQAGVKLQKEDQTTLTANTNMVADGAGETLTIDRATPITLVLYGKRIQAYTQEATVGDMLAKKNISLSANDTLSIARSTPITEGLTVEVWRNGVQTVTEDKDIPFETEQVKDADQPVGYHQVKEAGENGKRTVTYEIEMKNGQEVSRKEIQSVTTKEPKKQIEIIGTKADLPPGSHEDWMSAAGISANEYGYVNYIVGHEGGWEPCKVQGGSIDCTYAVNGGPMGYGVVQATPGSKMASAGSDWATNPVTQLKWATGYAVSRYGSWEGAYQYWTQHHSW